MLAESFCVWACSLGNGVFASCCFSNSLFKAEIRRPHLKHLAQCMNRYYMSFVRLSDAVFPLLHYPLWTHTRVHGRVLRHMFTWRTILSLWALALWLNPLEMHRSARLWALPPSSLVLSLFLITLSLCSLYPTVLFLGGKFLTWDGTATFLRSPFDRGVGSNESEGMETGMKLRDCVNCGGLGLELDS